MSLFKNISFGHMRHGIKVGLACVLTYFVSDFIGLPYAFWAVITAVIVMQMHVADSIHMCLYRFWGTAIGAGIGILAILVFPPTPLWTLLGLFVSTGLCAYLTKYNARFRMAAITVVIVYLTSLGAEDRVVFTLYRVAEIGLGVFCAFVVSIAVWPHRVSTVLRDRLETQFDELADDYMLLMGNFLSRQKKTDTEMFMVLDSDAQKNREMFHKVYVTERRFFRDDVKLLSLQVSVFHSALERLQSLPLLLNEVEGDGFDIIMAPELMELTRATSDGLRAIGKGEPHDSVRLQEAVAAIEVRFEELRKEQVTQRFNARRFFQVLSFINVAQHLGEFVLDALNKPELKNDD